jgi:hypothetical protein
MVKYERRQGEAISNPLPFLAENTVGRSRWVFLFLQCGCTGSLDLNPRLLGRANQRPAGVARSTTALVLFGTSRRPNGVSTWKNAEVQWQNDWKCMHGNNALYISTKSSGSQVTERDQTVWRILVLVDRKRRWSWQRRSHDSRCVVGPAGRVVAFSRATASRDQRWATSACSCRTSKRACHLQLTIASSATVECTMRFRFFLYEIPPI